MMLSSTLFVTVGVAQHGRRTGCVYRMSFLVVGAIFFHTTFRCVKGSIHPEVPHNLLAKLCGLTVKKLQERLNWIFSSTAHVSHQVCQFFVSSVSLRVRVTMVDKNKAAVCCLLATSAITLYQKKKRKRKMCSKKWYLKRNISCDAHLLNEMMPSWCRQVNWGNCKIPWVNCADDWKGQFWGLRYCLSKLRSLLSFSVRYDVTQ